MLIIEVQDLEKKQCQSLNQHIYNEIEGFEV